MLTVNHRITIGSTVYTSAQQSRLVSLRTHATLATPVNAAWFSLTPAPGVSVGSGDAVVIELGYGDDLNTVFSGVC